LAGVIDAPAENRAVSRVFCAFGTATGLTFNYTRSLLYLVSGDWVSNGPRANAA
jgi:hypothetical protein